MFEARIIGEDFGKRVDDCGFGRKVDLSIE
jgi:hypothetical protein